MERRKFLANLVCLGVGASIAPKVIGEIMAAEPSVDPRVLEYPLTEKEAYKLPDIVLGCITSLSGNEITVYPYSKLEEFPALKKGDKVMLFPGAFFKTSTAYSHFSHKEENFEHDRIVIQENIPCAGKGKPITLVLNCHALSHIRLLDNLVFIK